MARDPYKYFRVEARELADQLGQGLLEFERNGSGGAIVPRLLRLAHTLKGAARVVRQPEIAEHCHQIEEKLSPFRDVVAIAPPNRVDAILRLVDGISVLVTALPAPEPAGGSRDVDQSCKAAPPAEEGSRFIRTDVIEIDHLLDGVTETYAQVSLLQEAAALTETIRRISDGICEQLAAAAAGDHPDFGRVGRFTSSAELLRRLAGQLQRRIATTHERVDRELRQVRDTAEQLRLVPASALFSDCERAARDSAKALGREVLFEGKGGDIRVDADVIHIVQNAVIQIIRNAVAHGVEAPCDRIAANKPMQGRVGVTVIRRGRHVVFRCEDDGRGIDVAAVRQAATRKGRPSADLLDDNGLMRVLLLGGISTSTVVSEVAGRGIGMDIVRAAVEKLAADFRVTTEPGKGTSFELIVPLSVSSVEALVVEDAGLTVIIPLNGIRHTMRLEVSEVHRTSTGEAIVHDGIAIPLVALGRLLGRGVASRRGSSVSVVVVTGPTGLAAVSVDRLLGTSNVVFRSMPALAPATAVVAGASLDADGSPLLMLDPEGLVAAALRAGASPPHAVAARRPLLVIDDSLTTRMLEQCILESAGYEVEVATSGEEGLERARRANYALILVDVEMPGMDGFTFIEEIRRDQKLRDTPAILVTSRNAPDDKRRGLEVGAQGYVVKGEFDQADLLDHIKKLVA